MTQSARRPEPEPGSTAEPSDYEAWRDLQAVLEERDREWWAGDPDDPDTFEE